MEDKEMPYIPVNMWKKKSEIPENWIVTIKDFNFVDNHFNPDKKKPILIVQENDEVFNIDLSSTAYNELRTLFNGKPIGQQLKINTEPVVVNDRAGFTLKFDKYA